MPEADSFILRGGQIAREDHADLLQADLWLENGHLKGIGPDTADCMLLYAGGHPSFVVDAYTKRICLRHGWIAEKTKYDDVAKLFIENLPEDIDE